MYKETQAIIERKWRQMRSFDMDLKYAIDVGISRG